MFLKMGTGRKPHKFTPVSEVFDATLCEMINFSSIALL